MSSSHGNVNPANVKPLDPDPAGRDPSAEDPGGRQKALLQSVIFEVARETEGRSLADIRDMLQSGFARAGVAAPTNAWLDSVASAAFYGEPYIIDLPAALAADAAVAAPTAGLRERLATRRELRKEKLPAGIFPPASAWELADSEVTTRAPGPAREPDNRTPARPGRMRLLLPAAALGAAVLLAYWRMTRKPGGTDGRN